MLLFAGLAVPIVVVDQLTKLWVLANFKLETPVSVVGDYVRIVLIHNSGGLFGLFQDKAAVFAAISVAVMASIVWFELRVGRASLLMTVALGLLLGGALGNFIDRLRFGYVLDFVNMGIGSWRFYTFNVGDSAISMSILLLLLTAILPASGQPATD